MDDEKNNEKVERAMYESTKQDHARVQLDKISRFGLMEMSRQRIKPALNDLMGKTIWVRSVVSICESIFRLLTEKAINNKSSALLLKVSPNIANELLNRYRNNLNQIEAKFEIKILVFIDPYKQNDNYTIEVKKNAYFDYESELNESSKAFQNRSSYNTLHSIVATSILVVLGLVAAYVATYFVETNILTLILSFSPGGIYEVAVIAIAFDLDPDFVAFHHIIRLLFILFIVPVFLIVIEKIKK